MTNLISEKHAKHSFVKCNENIFLYRALIFHGISSTVNLLSNITNTNRLKYFLN